MGKQKLKRVPLQPKRETDARSPKKKVPQPQLPVPQQKVAYKSQNQRSREETKRLIQAAIRGGTAQQPVATSMENSQHGLTDELTAELPPEFQYAPSSQLLKKADEFFTERGQAEKALHDEAMRRLKHMKQVNKKGGDKEGFRFVVPKNVKSMVQHMQGNVAARRTAIEAENEFGGDGMDETMSKPMRKKKRKKHTVDDFYQFQTVQKWTRNAERFLARGKAGKKIFANRSSKRI